MLRAGLQPVGVKTETGHSGPATGGGGSRVDPALADDGAGVEPAPVVAGTVRALGLAQRSRPPQGHGLPYAAAEAGASWSDSIAATPRAQSQCVAQPPTAGGGLLRYIPFESWNALMDFMMRGLEIGPYAPQEA